MEMQAHLKLAALQEQRGGTDGAAKALTCGSRGRAPCGPEAGSFGAEAGPCGAGGCEQPRPCPTPWARSMATRLL
jgi:hypothetical protein